MGWFFRKSVSLGPMRLNLSKSGVGASFGVKGARVSVGSKGTHVFLGRGGIYYRQRIDSSSRVSPNPNPIEPNPIEHNFETLSEIQTASIDDLVESSADALLNEINEKYQLPEYSTRAMVGLVALFLFLVIFTPIPALYSALIVLAISPIVIPLRNVDRKRKTVVLNYDLDESANVTYLQLTKALTEMKNCSGFWRINAEGATENWKRNAGASSLIKRTRSTILQLPPKYMTTNIDICQLSYGEQSLCFLPDKVLIYQKGKVGVLGYPDITVENGTTRFIEDGTVPYDAKRVGDTWRYVRRDGGPDRRFSNNRQLPIMLYGVLKIMSSNGINLVFHCSKEDAPQLLKEAVNSVSNFVLSVNSGSQAIT